jgi:hypothetical protein
MICPNCRNETPDSFPNCLVCGEPLAGKTEDEEIRYSIGVHKVKDYYQILGLDPNCSENEIKIAYKKLAIKFHPDKNQGDKFFLEMFKEVQEAYYVLGDPTKRKAYNNKINSQTQTYNQPTYRKPEPSEPRPQYEPKKSNREQKEFPEIILTILSELIQHPIILIAIIISIVGVINTIKKPKYSKTYISSVSYSSSSAFDYKKEQERLRTEKGLYYIDPKTGERVINPKTGEWYLVDEYARLSNTKPVLTLKDKEILNQLKTGDSPYDNYFGKGVYDKNYHNELKIINNDETDVIVCLTEYKNKKRTIRNEYIRKNESFSMTNIPNGTYFIKTFSGNHWNPDVLMFDGKLKGFFETDIGYSKSDRQEDLLVMRQRNEDDGIRYSVHTITLHKVKHGNMESKSITATDFFEN